MFAGGKLLLTRLLFVGVRLLLNSGRLRSDRMFCSGMSLFILQASLLSECHKDSGDDGRVVHGAIEAELGRLMPLVRGHREVERLGCSIDMSSFDGLDPASSTVGGEISARKLGCGWGGGRGG